jgi:hypothetical protein
VEGFSNEFEKLKLETSRELNLSLAIQGAVGRRNLLEIGDAVRLVKVQRRRRCRYSRSGIDLRIDSENVRPVESVEYFSQKL